MPDTITRAVTDSPLWHFATLDSALSRGDDRAAAEAVRALERLGIEVRFRLPPCRRRAATRQREEAPSATS